MGGMYQSETFTSLEQLLKHLETQIRGANSCGLYLEKAEIKQLPDSDWAFVFFAYFST